MIFYAVIFKIVLIKVVMSSETTREPPKNATQGTISYKIPIAEPTPETWESQSNLKSLWVYHPASLQSQLPEDENIRHVIFKPPHLVTRLAKPFSFGFDPHFSKGYFAPFERRQKPVTLIAFRKNGFMPRKSIPLSQSAEVAELQSPYNEISSFWDDVPGANFNV